MSATVTEPRPSQGASADAAGEAPARRRRKRSESQRVTKKPEPIPGVEIREQRTAGGTVYYRFRVRFTNAMGERDSETFDTPQEALDFKAQLRLMKRRGNLEELDIGQQTLVEFMPMFWRLYAKRKVSEVTRRK